MTLVWTPKKGARVIPTTSSGKNGFRKEERQPFAADWLPLSGEVFWNEEFVAVGPDQMLRNARLRRNPTRAINPRRSTASSNGVDASGVVTEMNSCGGPLQVVPGHTAPLS